MEANALTPFSISPNPNTLYMTDSLRAVVQKSRFTIDKRQGLSCILGDVGLGKSTMLRYLWNDYLGREDCTVKMVPTADFSSKYGMIKDLCAEFGVEAQRSASAQMKAFQKYLFAQHEAGKNVILLIDEAQNLTNQQFEVLRSILNFESNEVKTIQIVLAGQIELRTKIDHKKNKYLKSRIVMYSSLNPLTIAEAGLMIQKRCDEAGIENPFSAEVVEGMYLISGGVPRDILKLCIYLYELKVEYDLDMIPVEFVERARKEVAL